MLTPSQVDAVNTFLDRVAPRGRVAATVDGDELVVDGERLVLHGTVEVPSLFFDPMPIALAMNAAWIAATTGAARDHVRWSHVAAPVAITLGQAARSAVAMVHPDADRAARGPCVRASGAALALAALASPRGARSLWTDGGVQRYPFTQALQGYLMVLRIAEAELPARTRRLAWGWAVGAIGLGLAASPRPRSPRQLLAELVWPLTTAFSSAALAGSIDADSDTIRAELLDEERERLAAARRRGAERMLDLVRMSIEAAATSLELRRHELDDAIAAEAARRIEQAQARLAAVVADVSAGGSTR